MNIEMLGLVIILILVLLLPFTIKIVERNLEVFLFVMGILAASISGMMEWPLIEKALLVPVKITVAVLVAGLLTKWLHEPLQKSILALNRALSPRIFFALTVIILGLISSVITAIIAAIILVMIIHALPIDRQSQIRFAILACYSIGMGAVLTPLGEPLSTMAISKLDESFFYLLELIGWEVIPSVIIFGILTMFFVKSNNATDHVQSEQTTESYKEIIIRAVKIYLFVMGLTFLGHGFEPFINAYIIDLPPALLYWINMISAVLDNATLAAAEVSPLMPEETLRAVMLGLIISGGMLIPGNIPNIIAAGKLHITSKEWARFGVPVGLVAMVAFFILLYAF